MNALTIRDLSVVAGEPRVHDLTLGKSLGFGRPRKVREIVERHRGELQRYGAITPHIAAQLRPAVGRNSGVSRQVDAKPGRGAPTKGFMLNEAQALLICMFSETTIAADVREQLIRVFMAYRAGELQAAPQPKGKRKLPPVYTAADPEHADFRDPLLPLAKRRDELARFHGFDKIRADAAMISQIPHLLAPTGPTKRIAWPRWFYDKDVLSAVVRLHRQAPVDRVIELLEANFGYRAPSRSSLGRFWLRLDGLFGTGRKLH